MSTSTACASSWGRSESTTSSTSVPTRKLFHCGWRWAVKLSKSFTVASREWNPASTWERVSSACSIASEATPQQTQVEGDRYQVVFDLMGDVRCHLTQVGQAVLAGQFSVLAFQFVTKASNFGVQRGVGLFEPQGCRVPRFQQCFDLDVTCHRAIVKRRFRQHAKRWALAQWGIKRSLWLVLHHRLWAVQLPPEVRSRRASLAGDSLVIAGRGTTRC